MSSILGDEAQRGGYETLESNNTGGGKRHLINALTLSTSFFLIFFAYSTTQNLESSLIPGKLGYWSLAALYASFCVSSLFIASPIANLLPPRFALLIGGAAYIPLTAANLYPRWATLIPAAVVLGCGAGVLWTAQGSYLTAAASNYARSKNKEPKSAMGLFTGIFFSIFQLTQVVGNLVAGCIFMFGGQDQDQARNILFYVFLGVAAGGVLLFLTLGREVTDKERRGGEINQRLLVERQGVNSEVAPRGSVLGRVFGNAFDVLRLLRDPRMFLMVPVCIYSGMEQSFVPGDFNADIVKQAKGLEWIGFVMAVYGAFDALASVLLGRMADVVGKRLYLVVGFVAHGSFIAFYMTYLNLSNIATLHDDFWILFLSAAVLGIADACWNTFPPLMMSVFFADNAEPAFGNLKFWQSIGAICPFVWGPLLAFETKLIVLGSTLCVATISVLILDLKVASISDTSDHGEKPSRHDDEGEAH
jgi:MFS family permease